MSINSPKLVLQGGNLSEYVEVYYHIPEAKYNDLPEEIKHQVNAARIIKLGKPIYKITKQNNNFETVKLDQLMLEWGVSHE